MNELQIFNNDNFGTIRTYDDGGKILFCGIDVAKALGYKNTRDAILHHCRGVVKHDTLTQGGKQKIQFITEGDLYRLITHSKLPSAEKFEKWVFDEVLPAIRKTGTYQITPTDEQTEITTMKQELLEIKQAIMALTSVEHPTIPSSKAFVKCNTKVALRKSYINYLLTVLEQLIGISRMEMLHQAYQTLERETNINLEKAKQEYINKYNKLSVSTLDAICDHEQTTKILIQILHFNMELQIAD